MEKQQGQKTRRSLPRIPPGWLLFAAGPARVGPVKCGLYAMSMQQQPPGLQTTCQHCRCVCFCVLRPSLRHRQVLPPPGKTLRARMPLHESMTQSACNRFEMLKQRYQQALTLRATSNASSTFSSQQQQHPWVRAASQLLTVTVQGAVLSKAHINAGSYIRPQELPRARKLLEGECGLVEQWNGVG